MAFFGAATLFLFAISAIAGAHSSKYIYEDLVDYVQWASRPDVIPRTDEGPVKLRLGLTLLNIEKVNLETNEVTLQAWLENHWNTGVTFNPERYHNASVVRVPRSKVWLPDLAVYNGQLDLPQHNDLVNNVIITSDGEATWIPPVKIRVFCDIQDATLKANTTCHIKMGSWVYSAFDLALNDKPSFGLDSYMTHESLFEVVSVSAKRNAIFYPCCPEEYHDIAFFFTFRKK